MQNNWQQIWNKRLLDLSLNSTLEQLLAADGFSSPFGRMNDSDAWVEYIERQAAKLQIDPEDSIFEVGCGAGAFLYPFYQKGQRVAGIDYAENLVKIARQVMPRADINLCEAINISLEKQFDIVVANSVFLYFPDELYAANVLQNMLKIASKSIGVFEVTDLSKKEEAIRERKQILSETEYEEKYKEGLDHLYYSRDWFREVLANEPVEVMIEDQFIRGYGNNKYRFNVFIHLKK